MSHERGNLQARSAGPRWRCALLLAALLVSRCGPASCFSAGRPRVQRAAFDFNLGNLFGGEDELQVPKDVAAMVAGLKRSTENALNSACSRLDVELPPSFQLGVENKLKSQIVDEKKSKAVVLKEVARGDRELARVFVEMLSSLGPGLVVAFRTPQLQKAAKKRWKLTKDEAQTISFPDPRKSAFTQEVGMPAVFRETVKKVKCNCLVAVAPQQEQLQCVAELSRELGDQMGIILLNARIHGPLRKGSKMGPRLRSALVKDFKATYHVRFLKSERLPKNSLLFRQVGSDGEGPWIVAVQRQLVAGAVVTKEVLRSDEEPSSEEIATAFERYAANEKDVSDKLADFLEKED